MTLAELRKSVASLGSVVGVWAHPDDESFGMAGLLALAARNNQPVACVTATMGEQGVQDESKWPAGRLGAIREAEAGAAMKELGVTNHHWLRYVDGECATIDQEQAATDILGIIKDYRPDTIVTFPPDGGTGHPDHIAVCGWSTAVADKLGCRLLYSVDLKEQYDKYIKELDEQVNIYFNLEKICLLAAEDCDLLLELTPDLRRRKCRALKAMPSQTAKMFELMGEDKLCEAFSLEAFVDGRRKDIEWGTVKPA